MNRTEQAAGNSQATAGRPSRPRRWPMRSRRRAAHRRRRIPGISVIPTLFTLGNLVCGFAAIHYAAQPAELRVFWGWTPLTLAGALLFLGMLLDAVDGSVARLTRSSSPLGAQLDSLADVLTFGAAPAFMTVRLVMNHLAGDGFIIGPEADNVFGKIIWGSAAVYVSCAALRLARFNVEMDKATINDHSLFRGLPSPGAAGTVASLVILHQHLLVTMFGGDVSIDLVRYTTLVLPVATLLCAIGMVSDVPYVHFTNRFVRGPRDFAYVVRIVVVLALAIWWFQVTLAAAFVVYALSGPVNMLLRRSSHERKADSA